MKVFLLLLLLALTLPITAQERGVTQRRAFRAAPVLLAYAGTNDAAGIAQTPTVDESDLP